MRTSGTSERISHVNDRSVSFSTIKALLFGVPLSALLSWAFGIWLILAIAPSKYLASPSAAQWRRIVGSEGVGVIRTAAIIFVLLGAGAIAGLIALALHSTSSP